MNSIKLINWSNSNKKVPSNLLAPLKHNQTSLLPRILTALLIDQGVILLSSLTFDFLIQEQVRFYLNNSMLKISQESNFFLELIGIGVLFFLYSYLSFVLNQGQTLGMKLRKVRIKVDGVNFSSYLKLSYQYCWISFTYGLSLKRQDLKNLFLEHDHLYHSLMEYKDDHRFKIIENIPRKKSDEIDFTKKAS